MQTLQISGIAGGFFDWEPTGEAATIRVRRSVMETIDGTVRAAFEAHEGRGKETWGLLLGTRSVWQGRSTIVVETVEPIADPAGLGEQVARLRAEGLVIAGFYRSQTRDDGFDLHFTVTPHDRERMRTHLGAAAGIFLVVRPLSRERILGNLLFWRDDEMVGQTEFIPFPFADEPARFTMARMERRDPALDPGEPVRKKVPVKAVIIFALLGALIGSFAVAKVFGTIGPGTSLGLRAQREQRVVTLHWDTALPVVAAAARGEVLVKDGSRSITFGLGPEQLRSGSFAYTPGAASLGFTLEIMDGEGKATRESVVFVDGRAMASAGDRSPATP